MRRGFANALFIAGAAVFAPSPAGAMPALFVGRGEPIANHSSHVVVVRDETRTVLSLEADYEGPAEGFVAVFAVPPSFKDTSLRVLPHELLVRLDRLDAPQLVERWEADPCEPRARASRPVDASAPSPRSDPGAHVEAAFASSDAIAAVPGTKDLAALGAFFAAEKLVLPPGADASLAAVAGQGFRFFVVRVDASKLPTHRSPTGKSAALLPPIRIHFDGDPLRIPLRLGAPSSGGTQDVIVHVLGRSRYEAKNFVNVAVPTSLAVTEHARGSFSAFYAALFDRVLSMSPGAAITEYAWDARTCEACADKPLDGGDLLTLGADVLPSVSSEADRVDPQLLSALGADAGNARHRYYGLRSFVLSRLHLRYKRDAAEDLYLRDAPPVGGGGDSASTHGAHASVKNAFVARYALEHPWGGPLACASPVRGVFGAPPGGRAAPPPLPAVDLGEAPRGARLESFVAGDAPELGIVAPRDPTPTTEPSKRRGCGGCSPFGLLSALLLSSGRASLPRRRRAAGPDERTRRRRTPV